MMFFTLNGGDVIWTPVARDIFYAWLLVWKSLKCMIM